MALSYEVLLPEILPMVPGCPDTLAEVAVRSAAIDFCTRTEAYRADLDPLTTVKNIHEYDFEPPSGTVVHSIVSATYDGTNLEPITPKLLDQRMPNWRKDNGDPKYFVKVSPTVMWLVPRPAETRALSVNVRVVLKPTVTSTTVDDNLLNDYRSAIVHGALYNLLRMPSKDWSDPIGAQQYGMLYEQEVQQAIRRADYGDMPIARKVKYGGIGAGVRKGRYGKGG
jgi:hypothetical protein